MTNPDPAPPPRFTLTHTPGLPSLVLGAVLA